MRVALTSLYVRDVDAAFRFYTEILGFVEKLRLPEAGLAAVVSPEQPDGPALLLEPNGNPIASPPLVFAVADLNGEYERLAADLVAALRELVAERNAFAVQRQPSAFRHLGDLGFLIVDEKRVLHDLLPI